jgi:hypothetical protein
MACHQSNIELFSDVAMEGQILVKFQILTKLQVEHLGSKNPKCEML